MTSLTLDSPGFIYMSQRIAFAGFNYTWFTDPVAIAGVYPDFRYSGSYPEDRLTITPLNEAAELWLMANS